MKKTVFAVLCWSALALGQPVLRSSNPVVNGGSYANQIAPGSIFVVFGTNLAGAAFGQALELPLQTTLGGVSIRFTPAAGGSATDALMVYTTRNQIAGLLPSSVGPGNYNVTVTYNGQTSAPGKATVVANLYGIVTADGSGAGQAQAQEFGSGTDGDLNRFAKGNLGPYKTAPASPGQVIVLWGTGIGADALSDLNGGTSGDRTAAGSIRIILGGREITPSYAGRASLLPGTDQVNFTIPGDAPTGCNVSVAVRVNGAVSNSTSLAIVPAGQDICQHPYLSAEALRRLSAGGTAVYGAMSLTKQSTSISAGGFNLDQSSEAVSGSFARYTLGNITDGSPTGFSISQIGSCTVFRRTGGQDDILYGTPSATLLDAGAQLTLNGPNANNIAIPASPNTPKFYTKTLFSGTSGIPGLPGGIPGLPGAGGSAVVAAGTYRINGTGGADVGAFNVSIAVPTPIDWTNRSSISNVSRSQNLPITWSGGGSGLVTIVGLSGNQAGGTQTNPIFDVAGFTCIANASAGSFSVPSAVLSQLPASSGDLLSGALGTLTVQSAGPSDGSGLFSAPLTAGGSTDYGSFVFSIGFTKNVSYQ